MKRIYHVIENGKIVFQSDCLYESLAMHRTTGGSGKLYRTADGVLLAFRKPAPSTLPPRRVDYGRN